jgi:hypothetical protein
MAFLEEESQREISALTRTPLGTVKRESSWVDCGKGWCELDLLERS